MSRFLYVIILLLLCFKRSCHCSKICIWNIKFCLCRLASGTDYNKFFKYVYMSFYLHVWLSLLFGGLANCFTKL